VVASIDPETDVAAGFVGCVRAARSNARVHALMSDVTTELGFSYFALIHHADLSRATPGIVHLDNYPPVWAEHFIRNQLYMDDPILHASSRTNVGFPWSAVPRMIRMTRRQHRILSGGAREGLGEGYTVPANIPGERMGSCSFVTKRGRSLPRHCLLAAQLVGSFAFEAARRIGNGGSLTAEERPRLSRRQRECVILAGQGKSDGVIAQLLDLSENTVANYLAAARERYGVASRVQLVTCALFDGEIGFGELLTRT